MLKDRESCGGGRKERGVSSTLHDDGLTDNTVRPTARNHVRGSADCKSIKPSVTVPARSVLSIHNPKPDVPLLLDRARQPPPFVSKEGYGCFLGHLHTFWWVRELLSE